MEYTNVLIYCYKYNTYCLSYIYFYKLICSYSNVCTQFRFQNSRQIIIIIYYYYCVYHLTILHYHTIMEEKLHIFCIHIISNS